MFASSKFDLSFSSFDPHSFLASPDEDYPSELDSPFTPVSPISPSSSSLTRSDSMSSYQTTSTTSSDDTCVAPLIINDPFADHSNQQQEHFLYHEEPLPQCWISSMIDNSNVNTNIDMTVKMESDEENSVPLPLPVSTILPPLPPPESDRAPITRNKRKRKRKRKQTRRKPTHVPTIIPLTPIPDDFHVQLIKEMKWNSSPTWQRYSMIRNGVAFDWCVPRSCLALLVGEKQNNRERAIQYQRLPTLLAPEFQRRIKVGTIHPSTQKTNMVSSEWVIKILQFRSNDRKTSIQHKHVASNLAHELVKRGCA